MKSLSHSIVVFATITLGAIVLRSTLRAEDAPASDGRNAETRKAVVSEMKQILEQTKLVRQGPKPITAELVPEPVLNWDDIPRGHHYGTLWVWGAKGRPAAIIEMYTFDFERQIKVWPGTVVHSLAAEPLKAEGALRWDWAPQKPGFTPKRLSDAPAPEATKSLRTLQMRALAKQYSANQTWRGDRSELRLLPTPVRLYDSADEGVLDGGLFAFVHGGTNPEVVLILEAMHEAGGDFWQFGCVRLGHAQMQVKFGDREAWSVETYDEVNPKSPYYWLSKP